MLKIDNIEFSYQDIKVLKKINLYIEKQDFLGIIGPNGSGKSTLLKNISNILHPDRGAVYLDKKLLNEYDVKTLAQKMAVVPQDTAVNFNFSVYDLIMMGRNPYQDRWGRITEKDRQIVSESMQLTDTDKFKTKSINELSGGEKQRVIIARAIAQKPEVLLLDEPTASLDINYQGEIFDLISYLNRELEITIITVSHDLNLTSQYCDELILLNKGKIYAAGTPETVLTRTNISEVYHAEVIIKENPLTERPYVTLVPRSYQRKLFQNIRDKIHIICGGGSGKVLMERLYLEGYELSCGVINQGDSDWEMAKKLEIDMVEIPPFSYIKEKQLQQNRNLLKKADIIIVADTPFGHGNVDNLKLVTEIKEKPVILLNKIDFEERDYTGGDAAKHWAEIQDREDSYCVNSNSELIELADKLCKNRD